MALRARAALATPELEQLEGRERAEIRLACEIRAEALDRCEILVSNNVIMLETLGVISLTRYVFELLVWMKSIERKPLRSLYFLILALDDGEAHTRQHLEQLNTEAAYFTEMSERDDPMPTLLALQAEHGDALTPDIVRAAERVRMDAIDTEARRHFSVYAA